MATPIFSDQQIIQYAQTRLFGGNVRPSDVTHIELHNGVMPKELEEIVLKKHGMFQVVNQKNAREPLFFQDGNLYIPQWSGFGRARRYEDMIKAYSKVSHNDFSFVKKHKNDDSRFTNQAYTNNAYDFVTGIFVPNIHYEHKRIFNGLDCKDISTILFGPTKTVAKMSDVIVKGNSQYIDSQIVSIKDKKVLNIGYVYSDQAHSIISKMLREYQSIAEDNGKKRELDIFMFGRVGSLKEDLQRHDLVFPTGIMTSVDIQNNDHGLYPVYNILAPKGDEITNFNVTSVINESVEQLTLAKEKGCSIVEMEMWKSSLAINEAKDSYESFLSIRYGFVGHISDQPLKINKDGSRDTLATELDSDLGEMRAFEVIKNYIKNNK